MMMMMMMAKMNKSVEISFISITIISTTNGLECVQTNVSDLSVLYTKKKSDSCPANRIENIKLSYIYPMKSDKYVNGHHYCVRCSLSLRCDHPVIIVHEMDSLHRMRHYNMD